MWKMLIKINKNLVYAIPSLMITGLVFGSITDQSIVAGMKTLIIPLTFLMVYHRKNTQL
jgi:hypothetical protein